MGREKETAWTHLPSGQETPLPRVALPSSFRSRPVAGAWGTHARPGVPSFQHSSCCFLLPVEMTNSPRSPKLGTVTHSSGNKPAVPQEKGCSARLRTWRAHGGCWLQAALRDTQAWLQDTEDPTLGLGPWNPLLTLVGVPAGRFLDLDRVPRSWPGARGFQQVSSVAGPGSPDARLCPRAWQLAAGTCPA